MEINGITLKKTPFYAQYIGTPHSSYREKHEVIPSKSRPGLSYVSVDGYNYDYMPNNKYKTYTGKPISIGIYNRKSFNPESKRNDYVAVIKDFGYGVLNGKSLTDLVTSVNAYLDTNSDILSVYASDSRFKAAQKEIDTLYKKTPGKASNSGSKLTPEQKKKLIEKSNEYVKEVEKEHLKQLNERLTDLAEQIKKQKPATKIVKSTKKLADPKKPRISWKMGAIPTKNGADRALWVVVEEKGGKWTANFTGNPPVGREKDNHAPFAVNPSVKLNGSEIPPEVKVQLGMFATKFNPNGTPIFKKIEGYKPKIKYKMPKQPKINKLSKRVK